MDRHGRRRSVRPASVPAFFYSYFKYLYAGPVIIKIPKYHFAYHIPIPVLKKSNKVKYQYHTSKLGTLAVTTLPLSSRSSF